MKNYLLFLSLIVVFIFAAIDYNEYWQKFHKNIAIKTPSQVEMKKDILKPTRNDVKNSVNSYDTKVQDNLYNEKLKKQQNNNIPQFKQNIPFRN